VLTIAGEPAYYAMKITPRTLEDTLTASGRLLCRKGTGQAMIGFFNAATANAWRTRDSLALRIVGRGETFFAYEEYMTQRWRAGSSHFTSNQKTDHIGLATDVEREWSFRYEPGGNGGGGTITATIDGHMTVTHLDPGHKSDGAVFDRFGIFNVMKHADDPLEVWIDRLTINGQTVELAKDPGWEAFQNRREYQSRDDRPYSDYGFSNTNFAGGKAPGEIGGLIFRGDIRLADGVNYYADRLEMLMLEKPLRASGRIIYRRGVQDSSTLIGFFNVPTSTTIDPKAPRSPRSWIDYLPRCFFGVAIKGPTRQGYFFHPTYRLDGDEGGGNPGNAIPNCPRLNPDDRPHDWSLEYLPGEADGRGRIVVTLDGQSATMDLPEGHKSAGVTFNRFGIISNWVDGNGQVVYLDDLVYTAKQE